MTLPHTLSELTTSLRDAFDPVVEAERNIMAALTEPDAMTPSDRYIYEMKIVVGSLGAAAGMLEGPIGTIAGISSVVEGLYHLETIGHQYRHSHGMSP